MNIYFIRHAQSMGNKLRTFSGVTDVELSDEGRASLEKAKAFFNDKEIAKIYVSPLKRCKDTAKIIFGEHEFIIDEGLKELNFGDWEGVNFKELIENHPDQWGDYMEKEINDKVIREIMNMVVAAKEEDKILIVVSNEVGMGIVPGDRLSRFFRDIAGRANQLMASLSDEAYMLVSGIPIKIKG